MEKFEFSGLFESLFAMLKNLKTFLFYFMRWYYRDITVQLASSRAVVSFEIDGTNVSKIKKKIY